ncbi:MAG: threonine synthase [Euryarchaeota archaeon]|jgi:threonine synthase|nr:threonine synthase [Euryarchaeota archaeon]HIE63546.1 threonine synthase [Candidatus Poseidoniales archaeon]
MAKGVIESYRNFLPVGQSTEIISLSEGNTPLISAERLVEKLGGEFELFLKFEGLNPTGSFKDRGMCMAVTKAVENGAKAIVCASTGNTSAAAAAYAARAGIKCIVLIPEGKIALGKLAQALMHGAQTISIKGNFDEALDIVRKLGEIDGFEIVNSINPYRIQGQKTAAFEIVDELGNSPDFHFLPVGNAGNITAYWMGYNEYKFHNKSSQLPKMMGWQAKGAAPFVLGKPIDNPETVATAIRIGHPASWDSAIEAANNSGGKIDCVSDEEILDAQRLLARYTGVFCEPASAASIAGLRKSVENKQIPSGSIVVATLTGHGLKDPDIAIKISKTKTKLVDANLESVISAIGL